MLRTPEPATIELQAQATAAASYLLTRASGRLSMTAIKHACQLNEPLYHADHD